jgi:hypothetical protein
MFKVSIFSIGIVWSLVLFELGIYILPGRLLNFIIYIIINHYVLKFLMHLTFFEVS